MMSKVDPVIVFIIVIVFSAISNVVLCKVCKSEVKVTESGKRDLGFKIVLSWVNCEKTEIPIGPKINF